MLIVHCQFGLLIAKIDDDFSQRFKCADFLFSCLGSMVDIWFIVK
jgi:hypothetical protein